MADSPAFDYACERLEAASSLSRIEARGTIRLSLKEAGLETGSVTTDQMAVVIDRVLPGELESRGVEDVPTVCRALMEGLADVEAGDTSDSPEAVFSRLGR